MEMVFLVSVLIALVVLIILQVEGNHRVRELQDNVRWARDEILRDGDASWKLTQQRLDDVYGVLSTLSEGFDKLLTDKAAAASAPDPQPPQDSKPTTLRAPAVSPIMAARRRGEAVLKKQYGIPEPKKE